MPQAIHSIGLFDREKDIPFPFDKFDIHGSYIEYVGRTTNIECRIYNIEFAPTLNNASNTVPYTMPRKQQPPLASLLLTLPRPDFPLQGQGQ